MHQTKSAAWDFTGQVSGGLDHGLVAHLDHGPVQPRGLHIAVVPLVKETNQIVGVLAEDTHDRFAGEAGRGGDVKFDCGCPLFLRLCQL